MIGFSKTAQIGKVVSNKKSRASKVVQWDRDRAKLKVVYQLKKITSCEYVSANGATCGSQEYLTFAHSDKRRNLTSDEVGSFKCTLLMCLEHHQQIEHDKEETNRLFALLRS